MKSNKLDIFEKNAEFFERFNNSLEDTAKDRHDRTRFTVTGLENKVEFAITGAQGRIKKAEQDAIDRINGEEGFNRQDLVNESVGDGNWVRYSELPDLSEYRKINDNRYKIGWMAIQAVDEDGTALNFECTGGFVRGSIAASKETGFSISQFVEGDPMPLFWTMPDASGKLALQSEIQELRAEIEVLKGKLNE